MRFGGKLRSCVSRAGANKASRDKKTTAELLSLTLYRYFMHPSELRNSNSIINLKIIRITHLKLSIFTLSWQHGGSSEHQVVKIESFLKINERSTSFFNRYGKDFSSIFSPLRSVQHALRKHNKEYLLGPP